MENKEFVYSKSIIEWVTVAAETCLFLENTQELRKKEFLSKSLKLFSLLYFRTVLIDIAGRENEGFAERFVTEEDYLYVKEQIEKLLGADDAFLETFHPDMQYSDTPIATFISENLADVYQELKDFAAGYQTELPEVMEEAVVACIAAFAEHWGQKLLNALKALHALTYNGMTEDEEDFENELNASEYRKLDRNSFLKFQTEDEEEEYEDD